MTPGRIVHVAHGHAAAGFPFGFPSDFAPLGRFRCEGADHPRSMAPKRRAATTPATDEQIKRYKECFDDTAEELICPITTELPVDPVTAEDGRVYERSAIEDWIARPGQLKSPALNTPMGPRLLPATKVRNIIERMVRTGSISGPKAEAWSRKLADEEEVKALRAEAEGGDADAMNWLGHSFYNGKCGLPVDYEQAASWYQRGHDLGNATCSASLGLCYEEGDGVEKDEAYALHLASIAADRNSEAGCFALATYFAQDMAGMRPNLREATRWFRAMESASLRDAIDCLRDQAAVWLRKNAVES